MRVPTAYVLLPLPHSGLLGKSLFLGLELRFARYLPLPSALRGADLVLPLIWNWHLGVETPLKTVLSEDSAWIGCRGNVCGLTGGPAPVSALNSVPAGEESLFFTSPAG